MASTRHELPKSATLAKVIPMVNELILKVESLESHMDELEDEISNLRNLDARGRPRGNRPMTDDDARRVLYGDLKDTPTREAAVTLGLSYGQVYSARHRLTFERIHKEMPVEVEHTNSTSH